MNLPPPRTTSVRAYTLIELLTVITIIAILMGLLYAVIPTVIDRARRVEAKNAALHITTAVQQYNTEYGKYPVADYATATPPTDIRLGDRTKANSVDDNADLFNILRAISTGRNANNAYNPKRIVFIEANPVKNPSAPKSGFLDAPGNGVQGAFYDPWGKQYTIIMDANYNQVISLTGLYSDFTSQSSDSVDTGARVGVGVFSLGKDGEVGSPRDGLTGMYRNGDKISDDIVSWQ